MQKILLTAMICLTCAIVTPSDKQMGPWSKKLSEKSILSLAAKTQRLGLTPCDKNISTVSQEEFNYLKNEDSQKEVKIERKPSINQQNFPSLT